MDKFIEFGNRVKVVGEEATMPAVGCAVAGALTWAVASSMLGVRGLTLWLVVAAVTVACVGFSFRPVVKNYVRRRTLYRAEEASWVEAGASADERARRARILADGGRVAMEAERYEPDPEAHRKAHNLESLDNVTSAISRTSPTTGSTMVGFGTLDVDGNGPGQGG